ncbi:hypothetical protein [Lacticaseibacillus zhaodongensis]|uniref:hypothetical protein n=1 Tax=Lacticaseibacillus zhaodongensis TaxID=2668065 RepID=UPI0012D31FF5|nr:hypothetical protein [Lacticaseibacillus zhaodongensis]
MQQNNNLFTWIGRHFLGLLALVTGIWYFFVSGPIAPFALYTFGLTYVAYYIQRNLRHPPVMLVQARTSLYFDIFLIILLAFNTFGSASTNLLSSIGMTVFVLGILGTDSYYYFRLRRKGRR